MDSKASETNKSVMSPANKLSSIDKIFARDKRLDPIGSPATKKISKLKRSHTTKVKQRTFDYLKPLFSKVNQNKYTSSSLKASTSDNDLSSIVKNGRPYDYYNGLSRKKTLSKVALSQILKDIPEFKRFLSDDDNVKIFREFLQSQFCQENIDFYLDCERYRNMDPKVYGESAIKTEATRIFKQYLDFEAKQPVNVDCHCLQSIVENLANSSLDLFEDAQMEIFELMRTDCYPRFCKTYPLNRNVANRIASGNNGAPLSMPGSILSSTSSKETDQTKTVDTSQIKQDIHASYPDKSAELVKPQSINNEAYRKLLKSMQKQDKTKCLKTIMSHAMDTKDTIKFVQTTFDIDRKPFGASQMRSSKIDAHDYSPRKRFIESLNEEQNLHLLISPPPKFKPKIEDEEDLLNPTSSFAADALSSTSYKQNSIIDSDASRRPLQSIWPADINVNQQSSTYSMSAFSERIDSTSHMRNMSQKYFNTVTKSERSERSQSSTSSDDMDGLKKSSAARRLNFSKERCPTDCPYNRCGLPCQQHHTSPFTNFDDYDKGHSRKSTSTELIDQIDLSKIHHIPSLCTRRSPPPLPPRRKLGVDFAKPSPSRRNLFSVPRTRDEESSLFRRFRDSEPSTSEMSPFTNLVGLPQLTKSKHVSHVIPKRFVAEPHMPKDKAFIGSTYNI